ncbi:MAG: hypothetical protein DRO01_03980 [Thermoproteota archaeon]|nr:MAG: hypothetical protein DRO01_03980 [Candidatus Korarchaeota archaeon]
MAKKAVEKRVLRNLEKRAAKIFLELEDIAGRLQKLQSTAQRLWEDLDGILLVEEKDTEERTAKT